MPLILESHDSLPYIDAALTPAAHAAASALIAADLDPAAATQALHPSIPASYAPRFSPALETEHARLAAAAPKEPGTGVDLARYEALDAPPDNDAAAWRALLQRAYTSSAHLDARAANLALLERYGKNAWLVANSQLEDILRALEADLARAKLEVEAIETARRSAQGGVAAELGLLDEAWRNGVARVIETEAAAEGLRRQTLERQREMAA
ncbi:uncharacterized protein K452DRAFT_233864 [Aplosporella prunicola CBS 121167]|uniref:Breast carcinoma amplified sequence 2 n=1 Tax=Aplosporella prunicola CBS 121167 TaxID=1176127 RepID=A0A6A6B6D9_9PEZI|nr:uncharacterized protein K452DRAFT_233864 [Aplosporella prunicola CBS 121167]KAF2138537.1 hypothetical protein K452DRAFT_233864 [Aplosporella prunicola CBS 121167]